MTPRAYAAEPPDKYRPSVRYRRPALIHGIGVVKIFRRSVELVDRRSRHDPNVSLESPPSGRNRFTLRLHKKDDSSRVSTDMLEELLIPTLDIATNPSIRLSSDLKPSKMKFGFVSASYSADIHVSTLVPKIKVKI